MRIKDQSTDLRLAVSMILSMTTVDLNSSLSLIKRIFSSSLRENLCTVAFIRNYETAFNPGQGMWQARNCTCSGTCLGFSTGKRKDC